MMLCVSHLILFYLMKTKIVFINFFFFFNNLHETKLVGINNKQTKIKRTSSYIVGMYIENIEEKHHDHLLQSKIQKIEFI